MESDKKLFSREHVLADDLSKMLGEPRKFAAYLGIAKRYYERDLRALARTVREKPDLPPDALGKYFFACLRNLAPTSEFVTAMAAKKRSAKGGSASGGKKRKNKKYVAHTRNRKRTPSRASAKSA